MGQKLFTRNFTLLVLGQASSLFGNYILRLALSMYVLEVTGSAAVFAGILSIATIPTILLSPVGGILADRADRRNIMVALDTLTGMSVLCVAVFLSGWNAIAVIGVLLVVLSVLGAFETPTVQACIPRMLSGDHIMKGNAVVNQVASISYLIAPLLGGILYAAVGLKPVMYASVVCFFIMALFECFIKLSHQTRDFKGNILSMVKDDFSDSIRFITKERPDIMKMLLLAACSRFFVMGGYIGRAAFSCADRVGTGRKALWRGGERAGGGNYFGQYCRRASYGEVKIRQIIICACGNRCLYHSGRGGISFPFRRIDQICRDCCCLLRHAGRDQYLFYFCGIYDPAEYAG